MSAAGAGVENWPRSVAVGALQKIDVSQCERLSALLAFPFDVSNERKAFGHHHWSARLFG
jgi:hypothetical protein